jgi:hypothetical protein
MAKAGAQARAPAPKVNIGKLTLGALQKHPEIFKLAAARRSHES